MSKIVTTTLEKVCRPEKGEIISGPFGSNISSKYFVKEGIPVIRGNNLSLSLDKFYDDGFVFVTQEKADELNCYADRKDLVFTAAGTIGQVGLIPENSKFDRYVISNKQIRVRIDSNKIDVLYAYYWFASPWIQRLLTLSNKGSTVPLLTLWEVKNLPVSYPEDIEEQHRIALVLETITKRIENNNKINKELESMAKTIYDYWFLQFEFPNENGKPYKSSGGKMVWSEELKREIPEGWEAGFFSNLIEIGNGKDHKNLRNGKIPVYGSGGVMRMVDTYIYNGESVLIPRKGTLNNILYVNGAFWTVDTMFYSKMKKKHSALYNYYSAKLFNFEKLNTGTGVPSMTSSIIYNLKIVIPPDKILERFDNYVQTFYKQIHEKERENRELVLLRDFLLPLLMNGQVGSKS